jgi:hypothetical protein
VLALVSRELQSLPALRGQSHYRGLQGSLQHHTTCREGADCQSPGCLVHMVWPCKQGRGPACQALPGPGPTAKAQQRIDTSTAHA